MSLRTLAPVPSPTTTSAAPPRAVPDPSRDLLAGSARELLAAGSAEDPETRYARAHLAALRAAAAVLAAVARPGRSRRSSRVRSAWVLLAEVAPELAEWAAFFAAGAGKRAAAEAGLRGVVTAREADDLVREAETFLALVARTLGVAHQPALGDGSAMPVRETPRHAVPDAATPVPPAAAGAGPGRPVPRAS